MPRRLGLVIGNKEYPWSSLSNPVNDATDVAAALKRDGFDVVLVIDAKEHELKSAIRRFTESVRPGDFAFVYYSGHGVEVKGINYLLPIDIPRDADEYEVEDEAVSAQRIVGDLSSQGTAVDILVLDACRDNPLRASRSTGGGLAPMEGLGSLVVFATQAGRTASDNTKGHNGLFTSYLLKALQMNGVSFDDAVRDVARQMAAETNRKQVPAIYGLLEMPVYLATAEPPSHNLEPSHAGTNMVAANRPPIAGGSTPVAPEYRGMGGVRGHVTNPTGAPQPGGTMSLSQGSQEVASFPVNANGEYSGSAPAGTYSLIYRTTGMTKDKQADRLQNIQILVGGDTVADDDMSRQAYIDSLPEDTRKQLEEMKQHNSVAIQANSVIKSLNADLVTVAADIHEADLARNTAIQQLGPSASKIDIATKESEIKAAKFNEVVTLMTKDTQLRPQESVLWAYLGQGQVGTKKYDDAETSFKKAIDLDATSKKPRPEIQALANAGLGEIYARNGKVPEATAAYDAAANVDPTKAAFYYKNESIIFSQVGNSVAQAAAADQAIAANPNDPIPYYLKGQALIVKATVDRKTQRIVLPPGCGESYRKYLELDPHGPYAADVRGILASTN